MKPINTWPKLAAAVAAVLLLSVPSAVGVARALEPTRGPWAAWAAAAGFELAYLSLSLLTLRPELRRQARAVALGAVATAIALNSLADYAHRVPGGLASWPTFQASFDPLALGLALGESLPLAGLAFALASLLHRLAEAPEQPAQSEPAALGWAGPVLVAAPSWPREPAYPAPVEVRAEDAREAVQTATDAPAPAQKVCPNCGAPLTLGAYGAAVRWGRCASCKPLA